MYKLFRSVFAALLLASLLGAPLFMVAQAAPANQAGPVGPEDATPPATPVRLVFIHHSTGANWLGAGLGQALMENNYYVSDTNYGWGPSAIGDTTDIGHWWNWFRSASSATYMTALFAHGEQWSSGWPRLDTPPAGENEIIMFKSCFPNSAYRGSPSDPVPPIATNPLKGQSAYSADHTVANAKGIYIDLLEYFRTRPDKLFIVVAAPPLMSGTYAANARAFNNWLVNDWLDGYELNNVAVFDFYNVLTSNGGNPNVNDLGQETGNHHRWWNGAIQHVQNYAGNTNAYPSGADDDHPNWYGNLKATGEFVPWLNYQYNRWKEVAPVENEVTTTSDVNDAGACSSITTASLPGTDGAVSLREAICVANNNPGADTITFNIPGSGVRQITLTSALPVLSGGGTTIDGYSQPGAQPATAANPATILIQLEGAGIEYGLDIASASNSVRGLVLTHFSNHAIRLNGSSASGNTIAGNYIGITPAGSAMAGNGGHGVAIMSGATGNTIGGSTPAARNVISGNTWAGVGLGGTTTHHNKISGNYIGTDVTGLTDLGNGLDGVWIKAGALNNTIGGPTAGERNVIAGNDRYGVLIEDAQTGANAIQGNFIGSDRTGTSALPNLQGVHIRTSATTNTVGGTAGVTPGAACSGACNLISGNGQDGIVISGSGTQGNLVLGNYVGTDVHGAAALGNSSSGISIMDGAHGNQIGGDAPGAGNLISGNTEAGVEVLDGTHDNSVLENYIGTSASGSAALGNALGIALQNASAITVDGNLVSGNLGYGVRISGGQSTSNTLSANQIGLAAGGGDLGNGNDGVWLDTGVHGNLIGGDAAGEGNVISGNAGDGIQLSGAAQNTITGNYIGTDAGGAQARANDGNGIFCSTGADQNQVGGGTPETRNIISGNGLAGVAVTDASGTVISGNYIGTNAGGTAALGNGTGVLLNGAAQSTISGNLISGNAGDGVQLRGTETMSNTLMANWIGVAANGQAGLGNGDDGVWLDSGAHDNLIGGDAPGERNVISGNHGDGLELLGALENTIIGNYIGTASSGLQKVANDGAGVRIADGSQGNVIGGAATGAGNAISGNGNAGVHLASIVAANLTQANSVIGNFIGVDASGQTALGNGAHGVMIASGAQNNTIEDNVIGGNAEDGVHVAGSSSNSLIGNSIGTDLSGALDLGNGEDGVMIDGQSADNRIEQGRIAHNGVDGVHILGADALGNSIAATAIYANTLGIHLEDGGNGGIAAPVITSAELVEGKLVVQGTACAGCTVSVYTNSSADGEGETYLGAAEATAAGRFSLSLDPGPAANLTATATHPEQGTSQFSAVYSPTENYELLFLPLAVK